jgi:uncharacterized protein (DUF2344 family)
MLIAFNLSHYEVTFYRTKLDEDTAMEIEVDDEYLRAEISYGKLVNLQWKQRRYMDIKRTLAHEITHILCNRFKGSNEPVVEHISRLLFKLYERK